MKKTRTALRHFGMMPSFILENSVIKANHGPEGIAYLCTSIRTRCFPSNLHPALRTPNWLAMAPPPSKPPPGWAGDISHLTTEVKTAGHHALGRDPLDPNRVYTKP
jgi:hypothetical protein